MLSNLVGQQDHKPTKLFPPLLHHKTPASQHLRSSQKKLKHLDIKSAAPKPSNMEHLLAYAVALLLFSLHCAHAQPAAAPAPAGPTNVTAILEKAGQFGTLIRLMKSTQVADQINNQLNNSNAGLTLFAPTDNAFSSLPPGTLNALTDQQKVALIQFHVLPTLLSMSQFQTVSNPLRTQAGGAGAGEYPLNVTSAGNQVNISTGIVNTTVSNTLYTDGQLAVYQVDKVLLPLDIFRPAVAPAPAADEAEEKKKKRSSGGPSSSPSKDVADASAAAGWHRSAARGFVLASAAAVYFFL